MAEEILINVTPREVRTALLENGVLQEIYIERNRRRGIVGNIYKGKVTRLLPSIQAAFVDIGLDRPAFLHVSDLKKNKIDADIRELLRPGQDILVQVYKDPLGGKGARLTAQFTIPGRFLVLTPGLPEIAVSQRIHDEADRERLIHSLSPSQFGGYIFRTAATHASAADIKADIEFLDKLWPEIKAHAQKTQAGKLVFEDIPLLLRVLRDLAGFDVKRIRVDDKNAVATMREFAERYCPALVSRIEYYADDRPIFDVCGVEKELQQLLERKVDLKSGGHVVFDQTEAMTTVDVNTGSYAGQGSVEEAAFKTNLEAVDVIARQVRLRNLGGIIIIDFIDLTDPAHKAALLSALTAALAKDSARTEISELSSLGLLQMTRKRTKESLEHVLCVSCPLCERRGSIKSLETVAYDIFREIKRTAANHNWPGFLVLASKEVINYLLDEESSMFGELEGQLGKPLEFRVEPSYTQEQFDLLPKESAW